MIVSSFQALALLPANAEEFRGYRWDGLRSLKPRLRQFTVSLEQIHTMAMADTLPRLLRRKDKRGYFVKFGRLHNAPVYIRLDPVKVRRFLKLT